MKRHIATALIAGIGLAAATPHVLDAAQMSAAQVPLERPHKRAICRLSQFGHLKSAGRFRRNEVAKVFVDDQMVFAEWSGQVSAPQPRRIETEELDAEWMAHCVDGRWLLSRRELVPTEGKMWSVQVYGESDNAAKLRIVGRCIDANGSAVREAFTVNFIQSDQAAQMILRGNRDGRVLPAWNASAATLGELREKHPMVVENFLEPALGKIVC